MSQSDSGITQNSAHLVIIFFNIREVTHSVSP